MRISRPPEHDDEKEARRWRGALFGKLRSPLMWRDKWNGSYEMLKAPNSVTFPICSLCDRIIWDWPHFEEKVPEYACCGACFKQEQESQ